MMHDGTSRIYGSTASAILCTYGVVPRLCSWLATIYFSGPATRQSLTSHDAKIEKGSIKPSSFSRTVVPELYLPRCPWRLNFLIGASITHFRCFVADTLEICRLSATTVKHRKSTGLCENRMQNTWRTSQCPTLRISKSNNPHDSSRIWVVHRKSHFDERVSANEAVKSSKLTGGKAKLSKGIFPTRDHRLYRWRCHSSTGVEPRTLKSQGRLNPA